MRLREGREEERGPRGSTSSGPRTLPHSLSLRLSNALHFPDSPSVSVSHKGSSCVRRCQVNEGGRQDLGCFFDDATAHFLPSSFRRTSDESPAGTFSTERGLYTLGSTRDEIFAFPRGLWVIDFDRLLDSWTPLKGKPLCQCSRNTHLPTPEKA